MKRALIGLLIVLLFPVAISLRSLLVAPLGPDRLLSFHPAPDWVYGLFPQDSIPFGREINRLSRDHGLDPHLVAAVITAESGFDPSAVSRKGAVGLMQVMPLTPDDWPLLFDPLHNLRTGIAHLHYLLETFDGDLALALAAYNAGVGRVKRRGIPAGGETRAFLKNVLDTYYRFWSDAPLPGFPLQPRQEDQARVGG
jgi:soluble lytic murein transglycosylase-like protein